MKKFGTQRLGLLAMLATVVSLAAAPATAATITFDGVTAPALFGDAQALTTQYASSGVTFGGHGAVLDQNSGFGVTGFSPRNFVAYEEASFIGAPGPGQVSGMASDTLSFSSPVSFVSFLTGSSLSGRTLEVRAFTSANLLVGTQNITLTSALQLVSVSAASIARLDYALAGADLGDAFVVDDVTINAAPVPEPASLVLLGTGLLAGRVFRKRAR